jgi:hypothetical protein
MVALVIAIKISISSSSFRPERPALQSLPRSRCLRQGHRTVNAEARTRLFTFLAIYHGLSQGRQLNDNPTAQPAA